MDYNLHMSKYIDTHGHLNSKEFSHDYNKYIKESQDSHVESIIVPGTSEKDSLLAIELSKKFSNVYAMAAIHPSDAHNINDADWLDKINGNDLVGVGECGIDLYWENNPIIDIQKEIFRKHLRFALKWNLPVAIHTRNAEKETQDVLNEKEFKGIKFLIHCNTMNKDWTMKFVEMGGYISFSGIVTFKNAKDIFESMMSVPLDRMLCETDAPYLSPVPKRGKTNKPSYVSYTAEFIAEQRKETREEVINSLYQNAKDFFSI